MPQFIYTMKGLGKVYPPDAQVLKDIWLSFYHGAKIGVLGLNGSGKSTLLKVMAGLDRDFSGEAFPAEGISIGYLSQEPQLDPAKTVLEVVEEGVAETRALLKRFDEINEKFAEDLSPEEMDKVLAEQARVQDRIDAAGAWELDSKLDSKADSKSDSKTESKYEERPAILSSVSVTMSSSFLSPVFPYRASRKARLGASGNFGRFEKPPSAASNRSVRPATACWRMSPGSFPPAVERVAPAMAACTFSACA